MACRRIVLHNQNMNPSWLQLLDRLLVEPHELESIYAASHASATEPDEMLRHFGASLWDVFSNNHTVVGSDGTEYETGSFRTMAGDIADALNRRYRSRQSSYGYLDFYMGHVGGDADAPGVYRWIFDRLKDEGCDWKYSFPRLYLIDFGASQPPAMTEYDPSEAVRAELERDSAPVSDLAAELDRLYEEAVEKAHDRPLPAIVAAYRDVYHRLPTGWPK